MFWRPFCSAEQNFFSNFGKGGTLLWTYFEIRTLAAAEMSFKCFFLFLALATFCAAKRSHFNIFGWGPLMKHFYANILKSGHWPRMRYRLKIFYFLSSGGHLVQWSRTIVAISDFRCHYFSLFRSRSHPIAKEQVSAQSALRFEKKCQELIFKVAAVVAILDFLSAHLAMLCLISALMLIIKIRFQLDYRGDVQNMNSQQGLFGSGKEDF